MEVYNYNIEEYNTSTDLCKIGAKFGTDKSPYNNSLELNYRHSYTPFYSVLFSGMKNKNINLGEVGIFKNSSIKMWREYFKNATLYAWDGSYENIENAKKSNLKNTYYDYMHTEYEDTIIEAFSKLNCKLDILIDDASHLFWDQIRLIRNCVHYLNPGSILIVEDLYSHNLESDYVEEIKRYGHDKYYDSISFINLFHNNSSLGEHNNDKIALMYRSELS